MKSPKRIREVLSELVHAYREALEWEQQGGLEFEELNNDLAQVISHVSRFRLDRNRERLSAEIGSQRVEAIRDALMWVRGDMNAENPAYVLTERMRQCCAQRVARHQAEAVARDAKLVEIPRGAGA